MPRGRTRDHGDPAAGDGEAGRGAQHPLEQPPQAPPGAGRAFEDGALGVHDLVAEDGEKPTAMCGSSAWHASPTATSTTSASPASTAPAASPSARPASLAPQSSRVQACLLVSDPGDREAPALRRRGMCLVRRGPRPLRSAVLGWHVAKNGDRWARREPIRASSIPGADGRGREPGGVGGGGRGSVRAFIARGCETRSNPLASPPRFPRHNTTTRSGQVHENPPRPGSRPDLVGHEVRQGASHPAPGLTCARHRPPEMRTFPLAIDRPGGPCVTHPQ